MAREKGPGRGGSGGVERGVSAFARGIALVYVLLGAVTLVLGIGLLAGWWTVYDLFGDLIERSAPPGLFARLLLPSVLAARSLADESGVLFVAIGTFHSVAGVLFLLRWPPGRALLLMLSGFYVFCFVLHVVNVHFSHGAPVGVPLAFLAGHILFFAALMTRAVTDRKA